MRGWRWVEEAHESSQAQVQFDIAFCSGARGMGETGAEMNGGVLPQPFTS